MMQRLPDGCEVGSLKPLKDREALVLEEGVEPSCPVKGAGF